MVLWCRKANSKGLVQMVKKELSQEKEHKILCLEKSLTISKQECAQRERINIRRWFSRK